MMSSVPPVWEEYAAVRCGGYGIWPGRAQEDSSKEVTCLPSDDISSTINYGVTSTFYILYHVKRQALGKT